MKKSEKSKKKEKKESRNDFVQLNDDSLERTMINPLQTIDASMAGTLPPIKGAIPMTRPSNSISASEDTNEEPMKMKLAKMVNEIDSDDDNIEITNEMITIPQIAGLQTPQLTSLAHHCKFFKKRVLSKKRLQVQQNLENLYSDNVNLLLKDEEQIQNQNLFLKKYAINFQIAWFKILDCKFHGDYTFELVQIFAQPHSEVVTYIDGSPHSQDVYKNGKVLRLLSYTEVCSIPLQADELQICEKWLAIRNGENIEIFQIEDCEKVMDKVRRNSVHMKIQAIQKFQFSNDGKSLIVFGGKGVKIYEMANKYLHFQQEQDSILDVQMLNKQILVAVHHPLKKQVDILNSEKKEKKGKLLYLSDDIPSVKFSGEDVYLWTSNESYHGNNKLGNKQIHYASDAAVVTSHLDQVSINDSNVKIFVEPGQFKVLHVYKEKMAALIDDRLVIVNKQHVQRQEALAISWPYVVCQDLKSNYVLIMNVFNLDQIQRVEISGDKVCKFQITENNLFVVSQKDDLHRINQVSLTDFKVKILFEYKDQIPLSDMFVRAPSSNLKQDLLVFLINGPILRTWSPKNSISQVTGVQSLHFQPIDSDNFLIQQNNLLCHFSLDFSTFSSCELTYAGDHMLSFKVDSSAKKLLVYGSKHKLIIYELQSSLIQFECTITNKDLQARLLSGNYSLEEGHMYYKDKVIKIRYDLPQKTKQIDYFDYYQDVFNLNDKYKVVQGPFNCLSFHKQSYIVEGPESISLLIVPHLHEKKIYLHSPLSEVKYFYTSIDNDLICMNKSSFSYEVYSERGLLRNSIDFKSLVQKQGQPVAISPNGLCYLLRNGDKISIFHLTTYEFIFVKEIEINDCISQYAKKLQESKKEGRKVIGKKIDAMMKINDWVKTSSYSFAINDRMDIMFQMRRPSQIQFSDFKFKNQVDVLNKMLRISLPKKEKGVKGKVADISSMQKDQNNLTQQQIDHCLSYDSIYYFQSGRVGLPMKKPSYMQQSVHSSIYLNSIVDIHYWKPRVEQHFVYFEDSIKQNFVLSTNENKDEQFCQKADGFILNNRNSIFWNKKYIWQIAGDYSQKICFKASEKRIKKVFAGSDPNIICIFIDESHTHDCLIVWNLIKQREKESFDIIKDDEVLWDSKGNPYILSQDQVTFTKQRCQIKCFEQVETQQQTNGHMVDGKLHNWILSNEYLSLPFCYMTFLIKHKNSEKDRFDLTAFNYIFNQQTAFTSCKCSSDHLEFILQNLHSTSPIFLQLLDYTYKHDNIRISPLHQAINVENNLNLADTLLKWMCFSKSHNSHFFKDIMYKMVDLTTFQQYLGTMQIQSIQMGQKHIIRRDTLQSEGIVIMEEVEQLCVDLNQYDHMGKKAQAVDIRAVRIDWILKDKDHEGFKMLNAIYEKDLSFYKNQTVLMLIEYLYEQFENRLAKYFLGFSILQLLVFQAVIMFGEIRWEVTEDIFFERKDIQNVFYILFGILNLGLTAVQALILAKEFKGASSFKMFVTQWRILDFLYIILNTVLSFCQTFNFGVEFKRRLTAFVTILIFAKFLYFLKLIKSLGEYVDSLFDCFKRIGSYLVILFLCIWAFSIAFYELGRNQMQFDEISSEELKSLHYIEFSGALWSGLGLLIGGFSPAFHLGNSHQNTVLMILYLLAVFIFMILSSTLYAILYTVIYEKIPIKSQIQTQQKLRFVLDKWVFRSFVFKNQQVKYVIVGFLKTADADVTLQQILDKQLELEKKLGY